MVLLPCNAGWSASEKERYDFERGRTFDRGKGVLPVSSLACPREAAADADGAALAG